MYSSTHIRNLFDVSYESVRVYTKEFKAYMSPTAKPPKGEHRKYVYDDLRVFALIAKMKGERKTYKDIHAALSVGARSDIPELSGSEIEELALSRRGVIVAQELIAAKEKIAEMESKIIQFEQQTPMMRDEIAALKGQLELYRGQFIEMLSELRKTYSEGFQAGVEYGRGLEDKKPD